MRLCVLCNVWMGQIAARPAFVYPHRQPLNTKNGFYTQGQDFYVRPNSASSPSGTAQRVGTPLSPGRVCVC